MVAAVVRGRFIAVPCFVRPLRISRVTALDEAIVEGTWQKAMISRHTSHALVSVVSRDLDHRLVPVFPDFRLLPTAPCALSYSYSSRGVFTCCPCQPLYFYISVKKGNERTEYR